MIGVGIPSRTGMAVRIIAGAAAVLTLCGPASAQGRGAGNANPGVIPPHAMAFGKTYGEWAAAWWNWALSAPEESSPLVDPTGENADTNQSGKVWFLAGTLAADPKSSSAVRRSTIVPVGKAIFFPIINSTAIGVDDEPEDVLLESATSAIDAVTLLAATIDGRPLANLFDYRAASGIYEQVLPEGALFDELFGVSGEFPAAADGHWILLKPLSPGEHTIEFRGVVGDPVSPLFEVDISYEITVSNTGPSLE